MPWSAAIPLVLFATSCMTACGSKLAAPSGAPTEDTGTIVEDTIPREHETDFTLPQDSSPPPDATLPPDAVAPIPDSGGDTAPDGAAAAACDPISGTGPFAVRLTGSGVATDDAGSPYPSGSMVTGTLDLYFPKGRVAGEELVAVRTGPAGPKVMRTVLDSTLSARGLALYDPACGSGVSGDLIGPTGGMVGVATINLGEPWSDVLDLRHGYVTMCRLGEVPKQELTLASGGLPPLDPVALRAARPFASYSASAITAKTATGPVGIKLLTGETGVLITPTAPTFPLSEATTIDFSTLRDVLGGPLSFTSIRINATTSTVTDLTFSTLLPEGSFIGTTPTVSSGVLRLGGSVSPTNFSTALAIGGVPGKTSVRLRHRMACSSGVLPLTLEIVSFAGKRVSASPKCSATLDDEKLTLPGDGAYLLVAQTRTGPRYPCNYGSSAPSFGAYELDEITFE